MYPTIFFHGDILGFGPKSRYKFSRAKWYTAHIEHNKPGLRTWLREQFGPEPKVADAWSRWRITPWTIYFRDEADYVLYVLKWE